MTVRELITILEAVGNDTAKVKVKGDGDVAAVRAWWEMRGDPPEIDLSLMIVD